MKKPKVAIVHDWLTNMGGAEKVVLEMSKVFPDAPVYTSTYSPESLPEFSHLDVRTTWLQKLPKSLRKLHKLMPIIRVKAFQDLDLSEYDIIISSSTAESKQVKKTSKNQVHVCYCHTPIRYYWSHYDEYRKNPGLGSFNFLAKIMMPLIVPSLKKVDFKASQDVDVFIANSTTIQKRIKKYYKKPSTVIHPPINTKDFKSTKTRQDFYMILGRQVPYKRIDLAVKACTELNIPLKVYGSGSEHQKLLDIAGDKVEFFTDRFGDASNEEIIKNLAEAKGFIFPSEEDFGIVQVEAISSGTPVIAYAVGGSQDVITEGKNGVFFKEQTVSSVKKALLKANEMSFSNLQIQMSAKKFDSSLFRTKLKKVVYDAYLEKNQK